MPNGQKQLPQIRTLETDIEARKQRGISPSEIVTQFGSFKESPKKTNTKLILIVLFLVLVGGGVIFGLFKYFRSEEQTIEEMPQSTQIGKSYIKADLEKTITPTISVIKQELETQRKSDSLLFLMIPQILSEFTQSTGIKIPESLIQNSHPSFNIFIAYHTGSSSVVFLIKTENFEKTYSSLLEWEKDMWQSFVPFLNTEDVKNIKQFSFVDEIIRNHDSRVLSKENKSILAYSIFNKQFVIIATSREALSIVLQRLIALPPK